MPPADVVAIAEAIGAADWKERGLDVAAEIAGRFAALADTARSEAAIAASMARSGAFVAHDETAESWFEDGLAVCALAGWGQKGVQRLLEEILPAHREIWAEKLLLTILWLEAGADAARGVLAQDFNEMVLADLGTKRDAASI